MKNISLFLCFFFFSFISTSLNGQTITEKLNKKLTATFNSTEIPGMAVAIVNKDEILYQNQFGYADLSSKQPYTQQTLHNIGSVSKTFIGVAIMQLVEQGKLSLDTKINDILPFKVVHPYYPETAITLRQLATHTSGIRDRDFNYSLRAYVSTDNTKGNRKGMPIKSKIQFKRMLKNPDIPLAQFLENTLAKKGQWYRKKNFYKNAPGTTEKYSNIAAALAAYVVELVTGEKYADYVQQHILNPLKMTASGWSPETVNQSLFAKRYIRNTPVPNYHLTTYPDGGLISSTADMTTYLQAILKGYAGESTFLSPASFQTMLTNQFEQSPLASSITNAEGRSGIFWDIFSKKGEGDIGHSGSDPGILSFMYFDPTIGVGFLMLTNTDSDNIKEVLKMWFSLLEYKKEFDEKS